jgi:hypothetical protein
MAEKGMGERVSNLLATFESRLNGQIEDPVKRHQIDNLASRGRLCVRVCFGDTRAASCRENPIVG